MDFGSLGNLKDFAKLLRGKDPGDESDNSDNESPEERSSHCKLGPGSVGPSKKSSAKPKASTSGTGTGPNGMKAKANCKDIWTEDEAEYKTKGVETIDLSNDPREQPVFETYYRQSVATEDLFLQMGNKTACTASCENLVVVIDLPGEDFKLVKLDIQPQLLILRSPKYIFRFPLPHPVDPNAGNAKWDQDKEKLTITLVLSRELDALNF